MVNFTRLFFGIIFLLSIDNPVFSQSVGDFRSKASGNWEDNTTWQVFNGTSWDDATIGQFPGGTSENDANNVYIEAGHSVTLQANQSCKDLHLNTTADVVRINTQDNTLDVWGKMRFYEGAAPGAGTPSSVASSGITGWISTGTSGYIRFRGTSNRVVMEDGQVNANNTNSGWNMDFAFDPGFIGEIKDRIRAGNITVTSGTLFVNDAFGELRIGTNNGAGDVTINGQFLVKSGATVTGGSGIFKKNNTAAESIIVEDGGTLEITNSGYVLAAQTLTLSGTIILQNTINFPTEAGRAGASSVNTFNNLVLAGTGSKTLQNNITVNGALTLTGSASLSLNSNVLSYGPSGELEYNGTSNQTTTDAEFPSSNGPNSLTINNISGVALHASRTIEGQLSLTAGLFDLESNNLVLGANSPAIAGTPSASNMIISSGSGELRKVFNQSGSYLFAVGDSLGTDEYSPGQITVNSADLLDETTYFGVKVTDNDHPAASSASDKISRYWGASTNMTGVSYDGIFQYMDADINGSEASLSSFLYSDETESALRTANSDIDDESNQIVVSALDNAGYISGANFGCSISNNTVTPPGSVEYCNSASSISFDGSTATVSSGVPTYQWQHSINGGAWTEITVNGNSEDYTEPGPLSAGTYAYRRIVSDPSYCSPENNVISNEITITVNSLISGNSIGSDQTVSTGGNPAPFTETEVLSGGNGNYTYQWQSSLVQGGPYTDIPGETNAVYDIPGGITQTTYLVRSVVSGECSSSSNEVIVTVCDAPSITQQPSNVTICSGINASFSVVATGSGTLTYQWQESIDGGASFSDLTNDETYSGVSNSTLTINSVPYSLNDNRYRCIITGNCNPTATSYTVRLKVHEPATVTTNPENASICSNSSTSFTTLGSGLNLVYQWQVSKDGGLSYGNVPNTAPYSGVNSTTLTISSAPITYNNYLYRCRLSASCSSVAFSTSGLLTVSSNSINITGQPSGVTICAGNNASYSIGASGTTTVSYQWQESINGGVSFSDLANGGVYSNVTTATLTISGAPYSMNNNKYRCVISGHCAESKTSNAVNLKVHEPATVNSNPDDAAICTNSPASFSASGSGLNLIYQWQVSKDGGLSYANVPNIAPYSGINSTTLNISSAPASYNNYLYRCRLSASCSSIAFTSAAQLTVNDCGGAKFSALMEENEEEPKVTAYPNPFSDEISINTSGFGDFYSIQIKDLNGKVVQQKNMNGNSFIMIGHELPAGIYIIEISNETEFKTLTVIKIP